MSRDDRRRKKARKLRNLRRAELRPLERHERHMASLTDPAVGPRLRRSFSGKVRRGDALTVAFEFSGIPVRVSGPDDDLLARHQAAVRVLMAGGIN